MQKKMIIVQKDSTCFLLDSETKVEYGFFLNKFRGTCFIMQCSVMKGWITKSNALELIEDLIKLRNFPLAPASKGDQLEFDTEVLEFICDTRKLFRDALSLNERVRLIDDLLEKSSSVKVLESVSLN